MTLLLAQGFRHNATIMRARRLVITAVVLLLCGGLALYFTGRQKEPAHKGRKLSEWVVDYGKARVNKMRDWEAEEAIGEIGEDAIPFLHEWMENREPSIIARGVSAFGRQISDHPGFDLTYLNQHRADCAAMAFSVLGPRARAIIPLMSKQMIAAKDDYHGTQAAKVLANIGALGLPELMRGMTNESSKVRQHAVFGIACMAGTNAVAATKVLIQAINDPDPAVTGPACLVLSRWQAEPAAVVPMLRKMLRHEDPLRREMAAAALGRYGLAAEAGPP